MTSPSSRRAWIEIGSQAGRLPDWCVALLAEGVDRNLTFGHGITPFRMVALLAEGVDRNLLLGIISGRLEMSPSSRRAWIEIAALSPSGRPQRVALLAEGVDRNTMKEVSTISKRVALLAEGVDRNLCFLLRRLACIPSPSSQRAWIEIPSRLRNTALSWGRPPRRGRG